MTCAACVAHVERAAYSVIKDKNSVTVSLLAGTITLILQENENEAALFTKLKKALSRAGYGLERGNDQNAAALDAVRQSSEKRKLIFCICTTAVLMIVAMWHMTPFPAPFILNAAKYPRAFFLLQLFLTAGSLKADFRRYFIFPPIWIPWWRWAPLPRFYTGLWQAASFLRVRQRVIICWCMNISINYI